MSGLIDGGSSGSIELDVVSAGRVFKDSARTQNSRLVISARIGAVADRPASFGRKVTPCLTQARRHSAENMPGRFSPPPYPRSATAPTRDAAE